MHNNWLTEAEMDRLELKFGANPPAKKAPEMTAAQKIATAVVFVLAILVIFY